MATKKTSEETPKKKTASKKTADETSKKKAAASNNEEGTPKKRAASKKTTDETSKKKIAASDNEEGTAKKRAASKKTTDETSKKKVAAKKTTSKKKVAKEEIEEELLENELELEDKLEKKEYIPDEVDIVHELPDRYNETKIVLMMRDPEWCFFYWDISDFDVEKHSLQGKKIFVRIFHVFGYDITNGEIHKEVEVNYIYGDRYVNLDFPHAYFIAELGYYDENNRFIVLARSNMIYAPRDSISNLFDEEWMVNEEIIKILKSPKALRNSLSSATIFELIDLRRNHLACSSSSLFLKKN